MSPRRPSDRSSRRGSRLLRHDLSILRNGFLAAFSTWRDRVLLAAVLITGAAWALASAPAMLRAAVALPIWWLAAYMLTTSALVHWAADRRLGFLASESPLAPDALDRGCSARYFLFWHGAALLIGLVPLVMALAQGAALAAVVGTAALAAAYSTGILLARLARQLLQAHDGRVRSLFCARERRSTPISGGRWRRIATVVCSRQSVIGKSVEQAGLIATAAAWLGAGLIFLARATVSDLAAMISASVISVAALALFSRIDHSLVRFAAFAGYRPLETVTSHGMQILIFTLWSALLPLVYANDLAARLAAISIVTGLAAAAILSLRIYQYRLRPKARADLVIQIDLGAAALLGAAFLPLGLAYLGFRSARLVRETCAATWLAP